MPSARTVPHRPARGPCSCCSLCLPHRIVSGLQPPGVVTCLLLPTDSCCVTPKLGLGRGWGWTFSCCPVGVQLLRGPSCVNGVGPNVSGSSGSGWVHGKQRWPLGWQPLLKGKAGLAFVSLQGQTPRECLLGPSQAGAPGKASRESLGQVREDRVGGGLPCADGQPPGFLLTLGGCCLCLGWGWFLVLSSSQWPGWGGKCCRWRGRGLSSVCGV